MKILISPHPDDETLFAAYTILHEKPLVIIVTYPTMQGNNGEQRLMESYKAMQTLGAPVCFLGIREDELTEDSLAQALEMFWEAEEVFVPEFEEEGNLQHNLVRNVAGKMFKNIKTYKTYTGLQERTVGTEIVPTDHELTLKKLAMECYVSQKQNKDTAHYFNTTKEYV